MKDYRVLMKMLKIWYPSMKRMFYKLLLAALLYILLYVVYISTLPVLFNCVGTNIETQKSIITFSSKFGNSFLLPLVVAILLFYLGIIEKERIQYSAGLNELISEMNYNCSKILGFPKNVEEKYNKYINEGKLDWLPKKESYTNWADGQNFYFKYLPTSAYFNFINNGYILDKKYLIIPTGNIAKYYDICIKFNIEIQVIENLGTKSINALCTFIKGKRYQDYLYGNDLNEGLIGEYEIILKALGKYSDVDEGLIREYKTILKNLKNQ